MKRNKTTIGLYEWLLLGIIILIIFFGPNFVGFVKMKYFTNLLTIDQTTQIPYEAAEDPLVDRVFVGHGNILVCDEEKLSAYNEEGKLLWTRELNGTSTRIFSNQAHLLFAEMSRGELVTVDAQGETVASLKDLGSIQKIRFDDQGHVAVLMKDNNLVHVFDANLQAMGTIEEKRGIVTDVILSDDGTVVSLSVINLIDTSLSNLVVQYALDGTRLGLTDQKDELIYNMYLDHYLYIVSDQSITSLNREGRVVAAIEAEGSIDKTAEFEGKLYVSSLLKDVEQEGLTRLTVYNDLLEQMYTKTFEHDIEGIIVNGHFIVVYYDDTIVLLDHQLQGVESFRTNMVISTIKWVDQQTLVAINHQEVAIYSIH